MTEDKHLARAAQLWTRPRHSHKQMDSELAEDIAAEFSAVEREARPNLTTMVDAWRERWEKTATELDAEREKVARLRELVRRASVALEPYRSRAERREVRNECTETFHALADTATLAETRRREIEQAAWCAGRDAAAARLQNEREGNADIVRHSEAANPRTKELAARVVVFDYCVSLVAALTPPASQP